MPERNGTVARHAPDRESGQETSQTLAFFGTTANGQFQQGQSGSHQIARSGVIVMQGRKIGRGSEGSFDPEQHEPGIPQGQTSSGRRQGVPQGTMHGPRLSTWRLFLWHIAFLKTEP